MTSSPTPSPPPSPSSGPEPSGKGPDISAAQVAGSALAAVSAAVVASFLGVGGTVIGAALGSIVASVGGAFYSHSFRRAGDALGETKVLTVVTRPRLGHAGPHHPGPADVPIIEVQPGDGPPPYAESAPATAPAETAAILVSAAEPPQTGPLPAPGGRVPRQISWKGALALTVLAFVLAVAAIEVFEVFLGRPISGGSGGTTITRLVNPKSTPKVPRPTPTPTKTPDPSSTSTPVITPTASGSATATPSDSATSPSPTGSATSSPTSTGPIAPPTTPAG